MKRQWIIAAVAGAALLPAPLLAQDRDVRVYSYSENRGRIGVMVDAKPDAATDKLGARIQSVIPGGPADEAGLKAGDIITRFNGQSLAGVAADNEERSGPAERLIELAGELDPGDEVELSYRRGDDTRTVTLTADRNSGNFVFRSPNLRLRGVPRFEVHPDIDMPRFERFPEMNLFFHRMPGGLNLTELNEDLAQYFGASEGALVMEAPHDSTLALKGGDVIVAIDGRAVESPEHARRILRSYNTGETAAIEILRQRNRMTIDWTVPEHRGSEMHFRQPRSLHKVKPRRQQQA